VSASHAIRRSRSPAASHGVGWTGITNSAPRPPILGEAGLPGEAFPQGWGLGGGHASASHAISQSRSPTASHGVGWTGQNGFGPPAPNPGGGWPAWRSVPPRLGARGLPRECVPRHQPIPLPSRVPWRGMDGKTEFGPPAPNPGGGWSAWRNVPPRLGARGLPRECVPRHPPIPLSSRVPWRGMDGSKRIRPPGPQSWGRTPVRQHSCCEAGPCLARLATI